MCTENYKWHFDYVRLAWDAGFAFEKYKYPNLDKNKICLVDIDRIIKERDVASVERFLPTVIQYILENDQAELLDINFVKMFRISQLSVEYLLFCKKYLDNTVVLLKKEILKLKEENKELKLFTEELENHISVLTKQSYITTFKCDKCPKAFSTEEYLNGHIKRRHGNENKVSPNTETDQLQSEIKQLKERLNITEKLLQEKEEKNENVKKDGEDESKLKIDEILEKFEGFKNKVENDLKVLQLEKNFYEEKYNKLFDAMLESNKKEIMNNTQHLQSIEQSQKLQPSDKCVENSVNKIEMTTQTEKENIPPRQLKMEAVHNKNIFEFKDVDTDSESTRKRNKVQETQETIEQKISQFEEQIELKISSGLNNIEKQMQAFWGKLSEFELKRETEVVKEIENSPLPPQQESIQVETAKPKIKPRMKLSNPTKFVSNDEENAKRIRVELEKMHVEPEVCIKTAQQRQRPKTQQSSPVKISSIMYDSSQSSESESKSESEMKSDSDPESSVVKVSPKKKIASQPSPSKSGKFSVTSLKKAQQTKEVNKEKKREEVNNTVNEKLQEIGISPNWKGIPQRTFERAIEIVRHQAKLAKKSNPNFASIRRSIEASLKKAVSASKHESKTAKKVTSNVINIRYKKKSKDLELDLDSDTKPSLVTIKNRSMYNTDSDSEDLRIVKPLAKVSEAAPPYSAVIQELEASRAKNVDTDSDVNSIILPKEDVMNEIHAKSALKNYPSVGSLAKKKVLFDIEGDKNEANQDEIISVDSSDVVKEIDTEKKQKKNGSSLSDFDFSEL